MSKKKKNPLGDCAICLRYGELRKSHIISQFNWKKLHKGREILGVSKKGPSKTHRGGIWEHLLCGECEKKFDSLCEDYTAKLLYYKEKKLAAQVDGLSVYKDIDYVRHRTYFLFTLWRMSVSKKEYFTHVNLSAEHNERLRAALDSGDMLEGQYPVTLAWIWMTPGQLFDAVGSPIHLKSDERQSVNLITNGLLQSWCIQGCHHLDDTSALGRDTMVIADIDYGDVEWLNQGMSAVIEANRGR